MQKTLSLVLAAAAAYGLYKYSKLSSSEKNDLKQKGLDLLRKGGIGNWRGKAEAAMNGKG